MKNLFRTIIIFMSFPLQSNSEDFKYDIPIRNFLGVELGSNLIKYDKDLIKIENNNSLVSNRYYNSDDININTGVEIYMLNRPDLIPPSLTKDYYVKTVSREKYTHELYVEKHSNIIIGVRLRSISRNIAQKSEGIREANNEFAIIYKILNDKYRYKIDLNDKASFTFPDFLIRDGYSVTVSRESTYLNINNGFRIILEPGKSGKYTNVQLVPEIVIFYQHKDSFERAARYTSRKLEGF